MGKVMVLLTVLLSSFALSDCGGRKLVDSRGGEDDEILFLNETPENIYRIQVVGTTADFTLRADARKAVPVPVEEESPGFNVNIEKVQGEVGEARKTLFRVKPGDTVRIKYLAGTTTGTGRQNPDRVLIEHEAVI